MKSKEAIVLGSEASIDMRHVNFFDANSSYWKDMNQPKVNLTVLRTRRIRKMRLLRKSQGGQKFAMMGFKISKKQLAKVEKSNGSPPQPLQKRVRGAPGQSK